MYKVLYAINMISQKFLDGYHCHEIRQGSTQKVRVTRHGMSTSEENKVLLWFMYISIGVIPVS